MPNTDWSKLNDVQLARFAKNYAVTAFLSYGLNVYSSEVSIAVKDKNGSFRGIHIKSVYNGSLIEHTEQINESDYICLMLFTDGVLPLIYLIPASAWRQSILKSLYNSDKSCSCLSKKTTSLLESYCFDSIVSQNFLKTRSVSHADFLTEIKAYLESKGLRYDDGIEKEIAARKSGKVYTLSDHVKGLLYSLMTNQTEWARIMPHLDEVDKVFLDYDVEKLKAASPNDLCKGLFDIKCGNRQSAAQMKALHENIATFERIIEDFGSMDAFVMSQPAVEIVELLSNSQSRYKLRQVGSALAWEYLRNVGIDGSKPDTHLRRFFGADRIGGVPHSPATEQEVIDIVSRLSVETGLSMAAIDNLVWCYCADGFGEICGASPKCGRCVIRRFCKMTHT